MDNKSSGRVDRLNKYSGVYKNSRNKRRRRNLNFFKYILAFLFIATLTYFSCMAIYSFVNREHISEVVVPENYDIRPDNKNIAPPSSQPPEAVEKPPVNDSPADEDMLTISAIELPKKYIFNNNAFKEFIKIAKRKGKNAIVVLLKDEAGKLLYKSNTNLAKEWRTCVKDAVLANNIAEEIKKEGLIPIAKLNAFLDNTAPDPSRENTFLAPNEGNNKKENVYMFRDGAGRAQKKWLNPCCDATKKYILDLVKEVYSLGFSYVLLENMRFADTEFSFSLGDGNMVDKAEVLKSFVKDLNNTGAKFIISYDIGALSDESRAINCFGGDISKYNIKYQAPIVGLSEKIGEDVSFYENLISNLKSKRHGIVFIPKVELKNGADEFVSFLKEKSLDSSIVLY